MRMAMLAQECNGLMGDHFVLDQTLRDSGHTHGGVGSGAHAGGGSRDRFPLMSGFSREISVGPMLESHELLRTAQVHLAHQTGGVARIP